MRRELEPIVLSSQTEIESDLENGSLENPIEMTLLGPGSSSIV
jgi:hypothetical protein